MPQHVAPLAPEARDGLADGDVLAARVAVDVAGVRELGDGGGGDEVDLGVGEGFEGGHGEFFGEGVDFGVAEELAAVAVDGGGGGVVFEGAGGELVGGVFARVEVFEEAGGRFEVVVFEVDGAFLEGREVVSEGWHGREGGERVGGWLTGEAESGAIASAKKGDFKRRAWWAVSWVAASPEPMRRVTIGDLR